MHCSCRKSQPQTEAVSGGPEPLKIAEAGKVADEIEVAAVSESGNQPVGPTDAQIGNGLVF